MDKTISPNEVAKALGVSRQTIYNRMTKDLSNYVKVVDGKKRLDIGVLDYLGVKQNVKNPTTDFDSIVKALTNELEVKNQQILALTEQNKELTAALQNTTQSLLAAQALHASTVKQLPDNTTQNPGEKIHWWQLKKRRHQGKEQTENG